MKMPMCRTVACDTCQAAVLVPCAGGPACKGRLKKAKVALAAERAAQVAMFKTEVQVRELIDERDAYAETISEVHAALGCKLEWTAEHAHDECVRELAEQNRAPF